MKNLRVVRPCECLSSDALSNHSCPAQPSTPWGKQQGLPWENHRGLTLCADWHEHRGIRNTVGYGESAAAGPLPSRKDLQQWRQITVLRIDRTEQRLHRAQMAPSLPQTRGLATWSVAAAQLHPPFLLLSSSKWLYRLVYAATRI